MFRQTLRTLSVGTGLLALAASCGTPTSSSSPTRAEIEVEPSWTGYQPDPQAVSLDLSIRIVNPGPADLYFQPCGTELQRREGEQWRQVWTTLCVLSAPMPPVVIPGGEAYMSVVSVRGVLGQGIMQDWDAPLDGDYRVRLALSDPSRAECGEGCASPAFALRSPG